MGNNISEEARNDQKNFSRSSNLDQLGQKFRVYIHRRNKIYHAFLRITPEDIILEKSKSDVISWPLQLIRRYGYTSAGVFFFESGRRCLTGEGLHCFQTQSADFIFQLVQKYIKDNADIKKNEMLKRTERSRSTGPVVTTCMSSPSRINTIQRFGSEGCGICTDFLSEPSSYNSYPKTAPAGYRLRKVFMPHPPRARSVGDEDFDPHRLTSEHFHSQQISKPTDSAIVGNIISESHNPTLNDTVASDSLPPRANSVGSRFSVNSATLSHFPYVNMALHEGGSAASLNGNVNNKPLTPPTTPTTTVFPLKWDAGAGATNILCFARPSPSKSEPADKSGATTLSRYVNLSEVGSRTLMEKECPPPVPRLNYADVSTNEDRTSGRSLSIGKKADVEFSRLNYAQIDAEKTRALQAAAYTEQRCGNGVKRRNATSS
ncbi:unnamed protein product [Auanema sp. JU1783]|nr:unnamed protein product [Auanema sp. JU1783]